MPRELIVLECTECNQRNYDCDKNKRLHPSRVEYKKYCRFCRKHTVHCVPSRSRHALRRDMDDPSS